MIRSAYGWRSTSGPKSCEYLTPAVFKIIKSREVKSVLDVGCGNGALVGALKNNGLIVAGTEIDHDGYIISKKAMPDINFYNIGVYDNPDAILRDFPEGFDCITSTEVVEHLFSPQYLPVFASGLLKEGGLLILTTPYHGYLKNLSISILNAWDIHHNPLWEGGHIKFWSRKTITELLEDHGFVVIDFKGVGRIPWLWKSMIISAIKS